MTYDDLFVLIKNYVETQKKKQAAGASDAKEAELDPIVEKVCKWLLTPQEDKKPSPLDYCTNCSRRCNKKLATVELEEKE